MSTISIMKRTKPNDKCPCISNKKYKQCCMVKDMDNKSDEVKKYMEGHAVSSEIMQYFIEYFSDEYKDHKIIDITNDLIESNYKTYQLTNFSSKIIMIAQLNENNKSVFNTRSNGGDTIIMYRGSYRTFNGKDFDKFIESITKMIITRMNGQNDI